VQPEKNSQEITMENPISIHCPDSLDDAVAILSARPGARILAGGTDLLVKHRNGMLPNLTDFVDISGLRLQEIERESDSIIIGSGCTMTALAQSPLVADRFPCLAQGAIQVGAFQIRNCATIGGNIANGSPAGDTIPAMFCLDAMVRIFGPESRRTIPIAEFFTGPGKTVLRQGEIIESFALPDRRTFGVFFKLGERRAHAISKVSISVSCFESGQGRREFRIALGAVGPTVLRCRKAEELMTAAGWPPPSADLVDKASRLVMDASRPIDDIRSLKDYRKKMTGVLFIRAIDRLNARSYQLNNSGEE